MNSIVLRTTTAVLLPIMLVLSVVVLLRGHNEPGGGFVGGLVAAAGFSLHAISHGAESTRRLLRMDPRTLIGTGLLVAVLSGMPALIARSPYLEGRWLSLDAPGLSDPLKVGTPILFDIGVYLLVLGGSLLMAISLQETQDDPASRD